MSTPTSLSLDLHLPQASTPAPVIVYLHGADGTKSGGGSASLVFSERDRGYAIASVEYRNPGNLFPAAIHDVKAAVRWLRANAAKYNLNSARIGVWGTSFGAYLAGHLGATHGVSALEDLGQGSPSESSRVQAVVSWAGFFDLRTLSDAWVTAFLGCKPAACADRAAAASPITYVDANDTPFLLAHGVDDTLVPESMSSEMHEALTSAGVTSSLVLLDGVGHTTGWPSDALTPTRSFLDRYLR